MTRFDLYERCAQDPERDVRILRAIHGHHPRTLGEDFCGTAALARRWVRGVPSARAIVADHDPEPLRAARLLQRDAHPRIRAQVTGAHDARGRVDVIAVLNFSIGEIHSRPELVRYLAHARSRLNRRGILALDAYAGADAFVLGSSRSTIPGPRGSTITYTWEQRHADPVTARVVNAMSFVVRPRPTARNPRPKPAIFRDAFVYDWRLWAIPELNDAMIEAGFERVEVYARGEHAVDSDGVTHVATLEPGDDLALGVITLIVARA